MGTELTIDMTDWLAGCNLIITNEGQRGVGQYECLIYSHN